MQHLEFLKQIHDILLLLFKVHIFWEGHKILQNLPLTFDHMYCSQKLGEDFAKFLWPSQNIWTLLYTMNYITRILLFLEQIFIWKSYAKLFVKSGIGDYLSCILSVPNCLEQAQNFCARSKIDLHIVLFTNFLCQSA